MKKFIVACFTIITCFTCLAGCSNKTLLSSKHPITLTMWHVYGEQTDSSMQKLIEEFNSTIGKDNGVTIKVTNMTTTPDLKNQLLASKEGVPGALDMPDIFSARPDTALNLGVENLVDFNKYFSQEELSNYVPEFVNDGVENGKLVVFPVSRSTRALFINASLFERFANDELVSYEDLNSWEGFFSVCEKYYSWSGGKPFCAFDYLIQNVEFDMLAKGNEPIYLSDGWYDITDDNLKESWLKFATPLSKGHIVVSDKYANTQIMTGEVVSGISSSAAINYYNDVVIYPDNTIESMNLKVLPLPKTNDLIEYMPVTGTGFSAWKTTDQKAEAAALFLSWLTEGKRNLDFVVEAGYMPVHNLAFDVIDSYAFPSVAHKTLFDAIRVMRQEYTPNIRPEFVGYYDKVEVLYPQLRSFCASLKVRSDKGENADALALETWDLFLEISKGES